MKFERKKTEKSKRILKKIFYFTFFLFLSHGFLKLFQNCLTDPQNQKFCEIAGFESTTITALISTLIPLSFFILLVAYIVHIFIEGLEKPTFIPTEKTIHNKFKNENASETEADDKKNRRPF